MFRSVHDACWIIRKRSEVYFGECSFVCGFRNIRVLLSDHEQNNLDESKQSFDISKYYKYNLAHESILARTVTAIFRMNSIYSPMKL